MNYHPKYAVTIHLTPQDGWIRPKNVSGKDNIADIAPPTQEVMKYHRYYICNAVSKNARQTSVKVISAEKGIKNKIFWEASRIVMI